MSSDHLVVDLGDHRLAVGDELGFGLGYGALVRAMTSPFVARIEPPVDHPVPRRVASAGHPRE
jgi:predicted amino acid racemase